MEIPLWKNLMKHRMVCGDHPHWLVARLRDHCHVTRPARDLAIAHRQFTALNQPRKIPADFDTSYKRASPKPSHLHLAEFTFSRKLSSVPRGGSLQMGLVFGCGKTVTEPSSEYSVKAPKRSRMVFPEFLNNLQSAN